MSAIEPWVGPGEAPPLREREVHVYRVPVATAISGPLFDSLNADEHAAIARFRHAEDACRFATGRAVLRLLVARHLGLDARAIVFDRTCRHCGADHGKPRIAGREEIDVNVSSSGELVVIALAASCVVGVDVEANTAARPWSATGMAEFVLAPAERAAFREADGFALGELWCCKEAVLKATGHGLAVDPRNIVLATDGDSLRVVDAPADHGELRQFAIKPLGMPAGYAGAIAVSLIPRALRLFAASHAELLDAMA